MHPRNPARGGLEVALGQPPAPDCLTVRLIDDRAKGCVSHLLSIAKELAVSVQRQERNGKE